MDAGYFYVLDQQDQGGVMMNVWYDIQITFVKRKLSVKWSVHGNGNNPDE